MDDLTGHLPAEQAPDYRAIARALLAWYRSERRDLPWRRTKTPYHIWVSEIMLQQTQVVTVIPYYERFLARFPTVKALADAALDEVLALWQGLGYYARARSLHAAAQIVRDRYGGVIPSDPAQLRALPGIGDYTAGAILSIAFGQDMPAIDGNVIRVLCRVFDYDRDPTKAEGKATLRRYAGALLPPGEAGDLNQALMELGAVICTPRAPLCPACPIAAFCHARALGVQELRPIPKVRGELPQRECVAAFIEQAGRLLLVRRVPRGLLGGLWELPNGVVLPGESHVQALTRYLRENLGVAAEVGPELAILKHGYTHFGATIYVHRCTISGSPQPSDAWDRFHWLSPNELGEYGLTGIATKALARLPWAGSRLLL